jgi:ABC-type branched-subunit amino acid transport system substrate-binding protein
VRAYLTKASRLTTAGTACLAMSLALAACGSRLDPDDVARVQGSNAAVPGGSTLAPGDPGSVAGTPGAGAPSDSAGAPGAPGESPPPGAPGGDPSDGPSQPPPGADPQSKACDGFKNQTGITDDKIVIANVSDISGPIPGLFEASQDAVRAYAAYFNSGSSICGRKLEVAAYDSRTDSGGDQQAYTQACESAFAAVGSMSAFDSGGAATAQGCGLPDLRTTSTTTERARCSTCYGSQSTNADYFNNAVPDYIVKTYGDAAKHAAFLYINAGAAAENGPKQASAMSKRGLNFTYVQGVDISEFNYGPYVQKMRDKGIRVVQWMGAASQAVRLAQAMQQQGFKPDVFMLDPTGYDPGYVEAGGDAVEGTLVFLNHTPFEEASSNAELQTYLSWLQQVKPGAKPSFFGLYAWSAAKLFVERSLALAGKLDRAKLVAEFAKVSNWTAGGLHAPQSVGSKMSCPCARFVKLRGGRWVPEGPTKYMCGGLTRA